jgi:hypothetical protein
MVAILLRKAAGLSALFLYRSSPFRIAIKGSKPMGKSFRRKRLQGQTCAYCGAPADTSDHLFARSFFPKSCWTGLPEVPACEVCNNEKSRLEGYLATVLLFGGRHADALPNLLDMGERRLAGNHALHRTIQKGQSRAWVKADSGIVVPSMAVPIDPEQFTDYFKLVVKGLIRFEFGDTFAESDHIDVITATENTGAPLFRNMLSLNAAKRARRDVGNGAFVYEGAQGTDPRITVWLITAFGGLVFQEKDGRSYETRIGALTGPGHIAARVELRQRWIEGRGNFAQEGKSDP